MDPMSPAAPAAGADAPDWIVLKFGGTSVSRRHRWDTIGRLMKRRADEEGARVLVVVSALSGVTNELQAICDGHADVAGTHARIAALVHRHEDFAEELGVGSGVLTERLAALIALGDDERAAAGELSWQAEVLAQGELLSSTLGVAYLQTQGLDVGWTDSRDWIQARPMPNQNEWSKRLSASCDYTGDAGLRARFDADGPALRIAQGSSPARPMAARRSSGAAVPTRPRRISAP